jgi:hypothetical protein
MDYITINDLSFKVKKYMEIEKPINEQNDVKFIISYVEEYKSDLNIDVFINICKLWTIREKIMMQTFIFGGIRSLRKLNDCDVQREHIPKRIWNTYYKPSKFLKSWKKSNFKGVAEKLQILFSVNSPTYKDTENIIKFIKGKNGIRGAGDYGAPNLVRIIFRAMKIKFPDSPNSDFLKMSHSLNPTWDKLKDVYQIYNVKTFNEILGTNYDSGEITYLVCMLLKKIL